MEDDLVDLLDGGSLAGSGSGGGATGARHAAGSSACCLVQLGDDGVADALDLLLLVGELVHLGGLVGIQPLDGLVALVVDGLAVVLRDLVLQLLVVQSGLHVEAVGLEAVLGRDPVLLLVVLGLELLSVVDHALDLLLGEPSLVVGDGDLVHLASGLVAGRHVEDTVGINVEGDLDLGDTARSWGNSSEIKLAKQVVVPGHGTLTLVDLDGDSRLVVRVGGEGLSLLGGNGGVPLDQASHDTSSGLNAKRQGGNVKEKQVADSLAGITSQDSSLDSSSIGNSLVGVD